MIDKPRLADTRFVNFCSISVGTLLIAVGVGLVPDLRSFVISGGLIAVLVMHQRNSDKFVLFGVVSLGLAPTLGWLGIANGSIDIFVVIASISILTAGVSVMRKAAKLDVALLPAIVGGAVTYSWWRSMSEGTNIVLLSRLLSGWDHFGHFYLFISAEVNNKFVALLPNQLPDTNIFNRKYPAGIHMVWSQWWTNLEESAGSSPATIFEQYLISIVATLAVCVILISVSIGRMGNDIWYRLTSTICSTILFVAFICFGPLSMSIWSGFPNFAVAITGTIVVISISLKPPSSPAISLAILVGATAMVTYNWYPLLVPLIPIGLMSVWQFSRHVARPSRWIYWLVVIAGGILLAIPVGNSLSFGVQHLAIPGGINSLPAQAIFLVLLIGCGYGLKLISNDSSWTGVITASPLILATVFQVAVTLPIRISDGTYPYYTQKIAYGMTFLVLATVFMNLVKRSRNDSVQDGWRTRSLFTVASIVACLGITQIFGYLGPDWARLAPGNTSTGLTARNAIIEGAIRSNRIANILINLSSEASNLTQEERDCLVLDDTENQDYDPVLVNYWVGTLTWSLTEEHILRSQQLIPLRTGQTSPKTNAKVIDDLLSPEVDCPVVVREVADELIFRNPEWKSRTWVIKPDGHIMKYPVGDK